MDEAGAALEETADEDHRSALRQKQLPLLRFSSGMIATVYGVENI